MTQDDPFGSDIDIMNKHGVATLAGGTVVIHWAPRGLSKNEALVFAAWLVTLADPRGDKFPTILAKVQDVPLEPNP